VESAAPTVYVVDDEPDVLRALSRLLRSEGLKVQTYDDAFTFLDIVTQDFTGCIVLDLSMPELDGLAVQRLLAEKGCRLPVVFLTGNGDAVANATAMQQGAVAFLSKPVDAEVLLGAVRAAFASGAPVDAGASGEGAR
jgi:FixJ family two-component response regulator